MTSLDSFPDIFSQQVHEYLKENQHLYGKNYHTYFHLQHNKMERTFFRLNRYDSTPHSFSSLCRIAGKMCGLFSFTCSNKTLSILLDAVKIAYKNAAAEEKKILLDLFGNKTPDAITAEDLLEIGLYEKVSTSNNSRSPGELLTRYANLKTIYAGDNQQWSRQKNSLPEYIHHWTTIEKRADDELLTHEELCTTRYTASTANTSDTGKIRVILKTDKQHIPTPSIKDANFVFLSRLKKTLLAYNTSLNYFRLKYQSASSKRLYKTLQYILLNTAIDNGHSRKTNLVVTTLKAEMDWIAQLPPQERSKPRRLIKLLTEAGFMSDDILNSNQSINQKMTLAQPS